MPQKPVPGPSGAVSCGYRQNVGMKEQTVKKQKTPRGADKRNRGSVNLTRIERDLKAYEVHLAGCTVRGVCEELGIRSTKTGWDTINRGKQYAIDHGIPAEERRLEIDRLFKETLGHLAQTIRHQSTNGCEEFFIDPDGNTSTKRRPGVDPRIAGELSRSLNRWAEFCGLLERAPEQNVQATTVVLSAPAAGADFESRYASLPSAEAPALEASATPVQSRVIAEGGPGWGAPPVDAAAIDVDAA